jgi:phosphoribosylaminoimidazole carboxylase (NCAIR synthetase)
MYNILGPKNFKGEYKPVNIVTEKGVFLKMYDKKESNPKRKLGHLNVVDLDNSGDIDFLLNKLEKIKKSIVIDPV